MPEGRPAIPAALERAVKEEAGHRCAITRCRATSALQIAHIEPWAKVREHRFENLILLCANDHIRFDQGEISTISMRNYKHNLSIVNSRYNDFERRLLQTLHERGPGSAVTLDFGSFIDISLRNLLNDGIVSRTPQPGGTRRMPGGGIAYVAPVAISNPREDLPKLDLSQAERIDGKDEYRLTATGEQLVQRWFEAEPIDKDSPVV